tara:strand:- start:10 stop:486 length:477 start_codon:yes stop_codon:yes gene_type:complete
MLVYQIKNRVNDKSYIGITTQSLRQRMNEHFARLDRKSGQENKFTAAKKKYGRNNFDVKVIAECKNRTELENKEIEIIEKLKPEYNIAPGGSVGCLGYRWSDEKKKKFGESRKGLLAGKKNPMYGKKGKLNPMANPLVKSKWIAAMEKRGYNMQKVGN